MTKSHAAVWASNTPTPAQLAELFRQIQSGRVTKGKLQILLRTGPSSREELARIVMGDDIIFPEEIASVCDVSYSEHALEHLAATLPSAEVFGWCRDNGYCVVAGPPTPMSILEVQALDPSLFHSKKNAWYERSEFASSEKVGVEWLAIRKDAIPKSFNMNLETQMSLLSDREEVPNAARMSWFITTCYKVRGVRLFRDIDVRTSSKCGAADSPEDVTAVTLGHFRAFGLDVNFYLDSSCRHHVGLAPSRKS